MADAGHPAPSRAVLHLATHNAHKVVELQEGLQCAGVTVQAAPQGYTVAETETTFLGNAMLKAEALMARLPAGALNRGWVLADDSGLEVEALHGAPGVRSARYAPEPNPTDAANVAHLLAALGHLPERQRRARFVCVLVLLAPGQPPCHFEGTLEGHIARAPAGAAGFGYDPVFVPTGATQTLAELGPTFKASVSHRARALQQLVAHLKTRG